MKKITVKTVFTDFDHLIAFGFGSGLITPAPGTWGTVAGLLLYIALASILPLNSLIVVLVVLTIIGTWCAHRSAKKLGIHDFGGIVIDEWAGIWLTLIFVPLNLYNVLIGFALFRLFDIVKPWPIKWFDKKVDGGIGIMFDDILAGALAAAGLYWMQPVL